MLFQDAGNSEKKMIYGKRREVEQAISSHPMLG